MARESPRVQVCGVAAVDSPDRWSFVALAG